MSNTRAKKKASNDCRRSRLYFLSSCDSLCSWHLEVVEEFKRHQLFNRTGSVQVNAQIMLVGLGRVNMEINETTTLGDLTRAGIRFSLHYEAESTVETARTIDSGPMSDPNQIKSNVLLEFIKCFGHRFDDDQHELLAEEWRSATEVVDILGVNKNAVTRRRIGDCASGYKYDWTDNTKLRSNLIRLKFLICTVSVAKWDVLEPDEREKWDRWQSLNSTRTVSTY